MVSWLERHTLNNRKVLRSRDKKARSTSCKRHSMVYDKPLCMVHLSLNQGLTWSGVDANVYFFNEGNKIMLLILYVDDVYLVGSHIPKLDWIWNEMTNLKLLWHSLKLEYFFHPNGMTITQHDYTYQMFINFGYMECNATIVPMHLGLKLKFDMEALAINTFLYQCMVGKLMFLTQTWPYIFFVVNMFIRFFHKSQTSHLDAIKHLFHYIKRTINLWIYYWWGEANIFIRFSNANWAKDLQDKKPTTRYVFRLGSSPITWGSRKQPCIVLSSIKVEYMVFTNGAKEAYGPKGL